MTDVLIDFPSKIAPDVLKLAAELSNKPVPLAPTLRIIMPNPIPKLSAGIEYDPELNRTIIKVEAGTHFFTGTAEQARIEAMIAKKYIELLDKMADVAAPTGG